MSKRYSDHTFYALKRTKMGRNIPIAFNTIKLRLSIISLLLLAITSLKAIEIEELNKLNTPLTFFPNMGQWQPEILFKSTSSATNISFLKNGLSFGEYQRKENKLNALGEKPFVIWNLKFNNINPVCHIAGIRSKKSKVSYFRGSDSSKWIVQPDEFLSLKYESVYRNIDLLYYGVGHDVKCDYIIHPGARVQSIQSTYEGIEKLIINKEGELEVFTGINIQKQKKPIAWQIINDKKIYIDIEYKLYDSTTFGFQAMQAYDPAFDLIIDPLFQMVWSSYTSIPGGSNNINYCYSNAMDKEGNVYLTGMVDGSFPITPGAYSGPSNIGSEVFIAKFSSDGTTLIYWTYLLGNSTEHGVGINVDELGRAYVTGVVELNITGITPFPATTNAYQQVHSAGADLFLTVLNPTGTSLVYSSFLGGTGSETGYDIALGGNGIVYLTGHTSIGNFPVKATNIFPSGDRDIVVAKFDINQSGMNSLIYSTRIGGGPFKYCNGRSIAVDSSGHAYITGMIYSSSGTTNFPITTGAYKSIYDAGMDGVACYVIKLSNTTPVSINYCTYIGPGTGNGITVDMAGNAIVVGRTQTDTFPVTSGVIQSNKAGYTDGFVTKLNANGTGLIFSTFLGGNFYDRATDVEVNSIGEVYVTGMVQDSFPTSSGAFQELNAGYNDMYLAHLKDDASGYACGGATLIGGSSDEYEGNFVDYPAPSVSLMNHGGINDTVVLSATTHSQDFPTSAGAYEPNKVNGIADQPIFFKMTCFVALPLPDANFMMPDSVCVNQAFDLIDLSTGNPNNWQWLIPSASSTYSNLQNPAGIYYSNSGTYSITLISCNQSGCDTLIKTIHVIENPISQFSITPNPVYINNSNVNTLNSSIDASQYQWYYNNNLISTAPNTNITFNSVGTHCLELVALNSLGCSDTSLQCVDVLAIEESFINVPNVFSPNDDDINDVIHLVTKNIRLNKFAIYNRWGEEVFSSTDLSKGWDGKYKGQVSEIGTYFYIVKYRTSDGSEKFEKGDITLLR